MWPLLQLDPVAQGLPCGPTLWLKCLPSGPAAPEPQGRGWMVNFATVSKSPDNSIPAGPSSEDLRPPLANHSDQRFGKGSFSRAATARYKPLRSAGVRGLKGHLFSASRKLRWAGCLCSSRAHTSRTYHEHRAWSCFCIFARVNSPAAWHSRLSTFNLPLDSPNSEDWRAR